MSGDPNLEKALLEYREEKERGEKVRREYEDAALLLDRKLMTLEAIKTGKLWKMTGPMRSVYHWAQRQKDRVARYGSVKGFLRKLASKKHEISVRKSYGVSSYPDEAVRKEHSERKFKNAITVSILVPLYNTPEKFLREMIESVLWQTYGGWQLCLADGSDSAHGKVGDICREYAAKDSRICYKKLEKNQGISGNTNECLKMATGEYAGLFDHDDILHPDVLYQYMDVIEREGADYLYCDETTFHGNSVDNMITMHFKPDFAIDNLRANNYICHFSVFKKSLLEGEELFRPRFDGSQDHDMILRLTARAEHIVHVPKLMYYWRSHKGSTAADINAKSYAIAAAKGAVSDHLTKAGFRNFEITSTKAFETIFRIRYEIKGRPMVSIVIPARDRAEDTGRCVRSILERSTYDCFEILIMDNGSVQEETKELYRELEKKENVRILRDDGDFNYPRLNNEAVSEASGEYILLLNNDTEVITPDWIEELLMYAQRPDVGAVGAKLYYPDYTIQHAGVVIGLGAHRTAGHVHYRVGQENLGYMGRLCYVQNFSAVTAACLMVKKSLYEEVGGLDQKFAIALNDVDFCLRLREKGLVNVWTPFAELFHYESASRGNDMEGERAERYNRESALFRERWKEILEKGDPYYNVNFSLDRSDFSLR
ncbi:MAG: glycosyltransferase family 2 protein [Lachnospiraceae bacterium]|nr:glycosyltransferase family 2 protein [Lachnospiraceae bacterium]